MSQAARQTLALPIAKVDTTLGPRPMVKCLCGHTLFDGIVVKARVVRLLPRGGGEALCRCKRWVVVPVSYCTTTSLSAHP